MSTKKGSADELVFSLPLSLSIFLFFFFVFWSRVVFPFFVAASVSSYGFFFTLVSFFIWHFTFFCKQWRRNFINIVERWWVGFKILDWLGFFGFGNGIFEFGNVSFAIWFSKFQEWWVGFSIAAAQISDTRNLTFDIHAGLSKVLASCYLSIIKR